LRLLTSSILRISRAPVAPGWVFVLGDLRAEDTLP